MIKWTQIDQCGNGNMDAGFILMVNTNGVSMVMSIGEQRLFGTKWIGRAH